MGNVYDAMKKFEAEQAARAAEGAPGASPPAGAAAESAPEAPRSAVPAASGAEPRADAGRRPGSRRAAMNGYAPELVAYRDRGGRLAEEYRALRTNLLARYEEGRFCILVTSAQAGEGKTVTCLNLGFVLAEIPDRRTLIVDGDLQKGNVNALLGMPPTPGLAEVLRGEATVESAVRPTVCPNLFVLPAGRVTQEEVGDLLARPELEALFDYFRRQFDHVLIDTPPIRVAGVRRRYRESISYSTAGILGRTAKDALLVVRMNKTARESVASAIRQLESANVRPVGLVLTHQRHYIPEFLYRLF